MLFRSKGRSAAQGSSHTWRKMVSPTIWPVIAVSDMAIRILTMLSKAEANKTESNLRIPSVRFIFLLFPILITGPITIPPSLCSEDVLSIIYFRLRSLNAVTRLIPHAIAKAVIKVSDP